MRFLLLPIILLFMPLSAHAAQPCQNPSGEEGDQIYNTAHHVMQYCNGHHWVAMGSVAGQGDNFGNHAAEKIVNMSGFKIENLAAPVSGTDAVTKNYVDNSVASAGLPVCSAGRGLVSTGSGWACNIPPPEWQIASLPNGLIGLSYSATLSASDQGGSVTYSVQTGAPSWLSLNAATGAISGTPDAHGTSTITFRATGSDDNYADRVFSLDVHSPTAGQITFASAGTHNWLVPAGVYSVSVIAVGGGGGGANGTSHSDGIRAGGGGGGALAYKNNIPVTPGSVIPVIVGARGAPGASGQPGEDGGVSAFGSVFVAEGGQGGQVAGGLGGNGGCPVNADGGGCGGRGGHANGSDTRLAGGGGGAGGYSGVGGRGGESAADFYANGLDGQGGGGGGGSGGAYRGAGGGGVGLLGQGYNGEGSSGTGINQSSNAGKGGSGGADGTPTGAHYSGYGGNYGGGAGGQDYTSGSPWQGVGGGGAVRIIWPGTRREYPSTWVADE